MLPSTSNSNVTRALCILVLLSCWLLPSNAAFDLGWGDDSDLTSFVTRPEIKAPRFNVTVYEPNSIDPGYWFVGPYAKIVQQSRPANYYQPCQTGPHIYDGNGDLIWSGACLLDNQNTCDLRAYNFNGSYYLSAVRFKASRSMSHRRGYGIIFDSSYRVIRTVEPSTVSEAFNMHEMILIDDGTKALHIDSRPDYVDMTELGLDGFNAGWIINLGIREYDLVNNRSTFDWMAHPHISVSESTLSATGRTLDQAWDWIHSNSIDKNGDGDYLYCARYTDAIYKVSGRNGTILWRLGGTRSDFQLEGFNFSRQHDARWLEYNDEYEVISLLDNGGDESVQTSSYSSGLKIQLDKTKMTAHVLSRWIRPGGRRAQQRGNFQALPSGNWFGGWSDNCHISEHASDGRLLMEAEFRSQRFVTYRAWKYNFTGNPVELPVLKAFAYGLDSPTSTVVHYVSWNGATEVSTWRFYWETSDDDILIGSATRTGFETQWLSRGYADQKTYAEAIDSQGRVIGRSLSVEVELHIAQREASRPSQTPIKHVEL